MPRLQVRSLRAHQIPAKGPVSRHRIGVFRIVFTESERNRLGAVWHPLVPHAWKLAHGNRISGDTSHTRKIYPGWKFGVEVVNGSEAQGSHPHSGIGWKLVHIRRGEGKVSACTLAAGIQRCCPARRQHLPEELTYRNLERVGELHKRSVFRCVVQISLPTGCHWECSTLHAEPEACLNQRFRPGQRARHPRHSE
jgi:hypothetical protein